MVFMGVWHCYYKKVIKMNNSSPLLYSIRYHNYSISLKIGSDLHTVHKMEDLTSWNSDLRGFSSYKISEQHNRHFPEGHSIDLPSAYFWLRTLKQAFITHPISAHVNELLTPLTAQVTLRIIKCTLHWIHGLNDFLSWCIRFLMELHPYFITNKPVISVCFPCLSCLP